MISKILFKKFGERAHTPSTDTPFVGDRVLVPEHVSGLSLPGKSWNSSIAVNSYKIHAYQPVRGDVGLPLRIIWHADLTSNGVKVTRYTILK